MCNCQARYGSVLGKSSPSASLCNWATALPLRTQSAQVTGGQRASAPFHAALLQRIVSDANLRPARRIDACTVARTGSYGFKCLEAGNVLILVACVASVACVSTLAVCVVAFAHRPTSHPVCQDDQYLRPWGYHFLETSRHSRQPLRWPMVRTWHLP